MSGGLRRPKGAPALYAQDGRGYDATTYEHYFISGSDWLVTEYDPAEDVAFGWVCLNGDDQMAELGYFSLAELEAVRGRMRVTSAQGVPMAVLPVCVERDEHWTPKPLREAIDALRRARGGDDA